MEGIRLKRLKIDKYRNVAPGTELVFNDGFNVLVGKNGTGKTTLLRLIAMVVTGRFGHLKGDVLGIEYELVVSGPRVIATVRNEPRRERAMTAPETDSVSIDMSSLQNDPTWSCEYRIRLAEGNSTEDFCTISTNSQRANLHFDGRDHSIAVQSPFEYNAVRNALSEALIWLRRIVLRPANPPEDTAREEWSSIPDSLLSTARLLDVMMTNGGRFDETLGGLDFITADRLHVTADRRYNDSGDIRSAFLSVHEGDQGNMRLGNFIPGQLHKAVSKISSSDLMIGNLRLTQDDLRFLQKAASVLGVKGVTLVLPLQKKDILDGHNVFLWLAFEFLLTLTDGTIISHNYLSYGQKRLLSFFYYAACNPDIVIADELVNGLHYEWIGACLQEIQDRQSFLTSQNPILLDMLPFESADEVKRSFILCSNEVRDGRTQMVWKTMSEQSADAFFRAYETQALQVSEILRTNNLW